MATIVKTPSGTWKAVVRRSGWPTASKSFRLKRDAENWGRSVEDEMSRGVFVQRSQAERTKLRDALDRYEREVTAFKSDTSRLAEGRRIKIVADRLGNYSLAAITPKVVADYRDMRLAGTDQSPPRPRAANTVRIELALLSHLFTVAIKEWGMGLTYNPVLNIRKPTPAPGRTRRLTPHEEKRLLAAVDEHSNPMLGWIVRLAIETGMRSSEITGLRLHQVQLDRRLVTLEHTKNASQRTVPLSKAATRVLKTAVDHPARPDDTDLVFFGEPGRDGLRRPYVITKVWADARARAKITDFRFHDLRHEAVSRLVEAGLSDQEVSAISGHKTMQMLKRYTHLRTEDLVRKLDRAGRTAR